MKPRAMMNGLLLLAGLALFASLFWAVLAYALPHPQWVEVGRLENFPPSKEPYTIFQPYFVYIIHDGDPIIVLDPLKPAPGGVNVRWNQPEQSFIDPSRGSWFNIKGFPYRRAGIHSILENQSLRRYKIKIENGILYFDRTHWDTEIRN